jgi:CheY-like chemotaxis protein
VASVLLVDRDLTCGRTLAVVLRRQGHRVLVVRTRTKALAAALRQSFDLAVVDLFIDGGGAELARDLVRYVPRLVLTLGMGLKHEEVLEAALGFPVHRKGLLPSVLADAATIPRTLASGKRGAPRREAATTRAGASSDRGSAARLPGFARPPLDATGPARAPRPRAHGRGRLPH